MPESINAPHPEPLSPLPLTLRDWLAAYRDGADPQVLLRTCLRRASPASPASPASTASPSSLSTPASTWIHLASEAELEQQLARLDSLLQATPDRQALIDRYPLFGVPFAAKDNIDIAGVPTTAACPAFAYTPTVSAHVITCLQAAGAVWLGKSNLDQFATGLVGTRSPYGQPASVFHADYISGGSSSGSAVAVGAGLVPFALGTDTAGSGRVPAGFNQLVGLKPTPGRVGASGVVPACRTLDCVSIFALTVDDAAHVLAVIEGEDAADCYSRFAPGRAAWPDGPLRIGVPREVRIEADGDYQAPYAAALEHARQLGHTLVPLDFSALHQTAELLYAGPWVAERHSVVEDLLQTQPDALDPVVRQVISGATRFSATDSFRAHYALKALQQETARLWQQVDLLLVPTAPRHPRLSELAAEPLAANTLLGTYTNFVNLLGWCALSLPAGQTAGGLPFGVTFIAAGNDDAALADFGRGWQDSLDLPLGGTGVRRAAPNTGAPAGAPATRQPASQATLPLAVVGAHLSGLPLNGQLRERGARLQRQTTTAPHYRLYALPDSSPPKPGLLRTASGGQRIAVEVWEVPLAQIGSFLALIPAPLGLGCIELADGRQVHGFLCADYAVKEAQDISHFGGWRAYLQSLVPQPAPAHNADADLSRCSSR